MLLTIAILLAILLALLLLVLLRLNKRVIQLINITQDLRDAYYAVNALIKVRCKDYESGMGIQRNSLPILAPPPSLGREDE